MTAVVPGTRARLRPLAIREDDDTPGCYVVGRLDGGDFVELPELGVRAIELVGEGLTLEEVEDRLTDGDDRPDVVGLVDDLVQLSWVETLDGRRLPDPHEATGSHLAWLRPAHVRWLFSLPALLAWCLLAVAAVATLAYRPRLLPTADDFFWTDYVGLATLGNTAMFLAGAIVHELMHLAAARSAGLPARIGLGTRLHNLVLQTDVSAAWSLPRGRRYRIYLAGMAWDVAAISAAILVRAYADPAPTVHMLLGAFILIAALNLVLQFQVFMRTDVYYVLMEALRCRDLFHDGLRHVTHVARRVAGAFHRRSMPPSPTEALDPHEARAVRLYAPVLVLGTCVALAAYSVLVLPILVRTAVSGGAAVADVASGGSLTRGIDGAAVLTVEIGLQLLFVQTFYRSHMTWFGRTDPTKGGDHHAHADQDPPS